MYERVEAAAASIAGVRLTLRRLEPAPSVFASWLDYVPAHSDGHLVADHRRLLQNVMAGAGLTCDEASLELLEEEVERASKDGFRLVRGHDYIALLLKLLHSTWGRRISGSRFNGWTESQLARMLFVAADPAELDRYPLFDQLRVRFRV